ncbi:MAG: MFS transporter [Leptospirillia bacterium]
MATATRSGGFFFSILSMDRPLFLLLTGQLISQTGENLYRVALLWFVSLSSRHVTDMVIVGVLQTLPPLLFGGPGGVWLDRHDKKRIMIGVDLLRALGVLLIPLLAALHLLTHSLLYVLVFIISALSGLFGPALSSILPLIVPREKLLRGNALLQTTGQAGLLAGPVIAGILAVIWSASGEMVLTGLTFFLSAVFLVFIRTTSHHSPGTPSPSPSEIPSRPGMLSEIAEGVRFVLAPPRPLLPAFLFMTLFGIVTGPLNIMLLVLSRHVLSRGAEGFGDLTGAFGAGMLASTLLLTFYTPKNVIRFVVGGFALAGLLSFGVGETRSYSLDLALFFFWGAAVNVVSPLSQTMIQHLTPRRLLARVLTVMSVGFLLGILLGILLFPPLSSTLGTRSVFVLMGTLLLTPLLAIGMGNLVKGIRRLLFPFEATPENERSSS